MSEETLSDKIFEFDEEEDEHLRNKKNDYPTTWQSLPDRDVVETKDVKQFIKELKEVAEENDWEVAVDNGYPDGFQVISGVEFINKKAGDKLIE